MCSLVRNLEPYKSLKNVLHVWRLVLNRISLPAEYCEIRVKYSATLDVGYATPENYPNFPPELDLRTSSVQKFCTPTSC